MNHHAVLRTAAVILLTMGCIARASVMRTISQDEVDKAFPKVAPSHPRLIITDQTLASVKTRIQQNSAYAGFYRALLDKADHILNTKPVERKKIGRRLLSVSRRCLDRVMTLSMVYRLSGQKVYLKRAEAELLAVASFSDYNPSHFLDVAEMCTALAIGYDWLYRDLSESSREKIRQAIVNKAIQPALKGRHWWLNRDMNWNQVCNGGITLGALAIMEDEPALSRHLVHRAVNAIQHAMAVYEPDGAYPEGPGYWVYGTSYNCLFLAALDSTLGMDFGLSRMSGYSRAAKYFLHIAGPTGLYFNYPDSGRNGGFVPAVFWFASRYNDPSVTWTQYQIWRQAMKNNPSTLVHSRFAPLALAWAGRPPQKPKALSWMGRGHNPVAMFRSAWDDPQAVFLGIKGGSPSVNHGHMDVGSFVLDAAGSRWASDLGPESYHKIESLGLNLWGHSQNADRWKIYRYNNTSHNTLVVNGQYQRVGGYAPIIRYSNAKQFPHVVFDLSDVYRGQLDSAMRGAALLPTGQVIVQDELIASDQKATVRWAMVTHASIQPKSNSTVDLKQNGKTMRLKVMGDIQPAWTTYSTKPKADYDAPNPDTRMVGFAFTLNPGQAVRYQVRFTPPDTPVGTEQPLRPVQNWSDPMPQNN